MSGVSVVSHSEHMDAVGRRVLECESRLKKAKARLLGTARRGRNIGKALKRYDEERDRHRQAMCAYSALIDRSEGEAQ